MTSFAPSALAHAGRTVNHTLLQRYLHRHGYESIIARTSSDATLVQVEDATNRYATTGILDAIARTSLMLPPSTQRVIFVTQKYGVPLIAMHNIGFSDMKTQNDRQLKMPKMQISHRADQIIAVMKNYPSLNRSQFKTDIIFHPDLIMQFGNYNNPIEAQFNIIPEVQTLLFPGVLFSASIIFPLYNELEPWGNQVRLGPTTLNFLTRLKNDIYLFGAGGYFVGYRYGAEGGIKKYFYDGTVVLDSRMGYTGYARMENGAFWITDWQDLTYSISAQIFERKYHTFATIGYHKFISQNNGWRFELSRFFNEFLFGFWGTYTEHSFNGGIHMSLPLPPRHYKSRGLIRPRIASYYKMMYVGKYTADNGARLYANTIMDDVLLRNNPQYLRSKLDRLDGSRKR
jgi:hypothetical protein